MIRHLRPNDGATELIQVVLDDASFERLENAATRRGLGVEQLVVLLLHAASLQIDDMVETPNQVVRHAADAGSPAPSDLV